MEPATKSRESKWGKVVFLFLCLSLVFLGIGRIEFPAPRASFSSWSVSRGVFLFWLAWKLSIALRFGMANLDCRNVFAPLPLVLFFLFVTASLLPDFRLWEDYPYFLFAFLHYLMVVDCFSSHSRPRLLLCLLGIAPGFLFLRGVVTDPSVLNFSQMIRFSLPLDHPNKAGYLFAMGIPLALAVVFRERGWLRGMGVLSLGSQSLGLILTYSRGAWLGTLAALLSLGLLERGFRRTLLVIGFITLILFVLSGSLLGRLASLTDATRDPDIVWRLQVMSRAISIGLEHPFLGVGYGRERLRAALKERDPEFFAQRLVPHSHNVYTELFAETGFLGLGAFLWVVGLTVMRLVEKATPKETPVNRSVYLCIFASVVAFAVTGLWDVPFYHHEARIFFFSLLALANIYGRREI